MARCLSIWSERFTSRQSSGGRLVMSCIVLVSSDRCASIAEHGALTRQHPEDRNADAVVLISTRDQSRTCHARLHRDWFPTR